MVEDEDEKLGCIPDDWNSVKNDYQYQKQNASSFIFNFQPNHQWAINAPCQSYAMADA